MRPNWKECPRGDIEPQYADQFSVTMNKKGNIVMSRRTCQNMGSPKAFVLLFDTVNSRIGLKPAALATRNAYPVRTANRKSGSKLIRGHRLTKEFRITIPETLRFYDADTDQDGILILDLRTARPSPRAVNHWMKRGKVRIVTSDE